MRPWTGAAHEAATEKLPFGMANDEVNSVYAPATGWFYLVGWPPDVPTNATWRLEVRYGRAPSRAAEKLDDALGLHVFARRGKGQTIWTPEVSR